MIDKLIAIFYISFFIFLIKLFVYFISKYKLKKIEKHKNCIDGIEFYLLDSNSHETIIAKETKLVRSQIEKIIPLYEGKSKIISFREGIKKTSPEYAYFEDGEIIFSHTRSYNKNFERNVPINTSLMNVEKIKEDNNDSKTTFIDNGKIINDNKTNYYWIILAVFAILVLLGSIYTISLNKTTEQDNSKQDIEDNSEIKYGPLKSNSYIYIDELDMLHLDANCELINGDHNQLYRIPISEMKGRNVSLCCALCFSEEQKNALIDYALSSTPHNNESQYEYTYQECLDYKNGMLAAAQKMSKSLPLKTNEIQTLFNIGIQDHLITYCYEVDGYDSQTKIPQEEIEELKKNTLTGLTRIDNPKGLLKETMERMDIKIQYMMYSKKPRIFIGGFQIAYTDL